mgnify:CR=1 FL=1
MSENYKYFSHRDCEFFPCHEGAEPEDPELSEPPAWGAAHPVSRKHSKKIISFFINASWEKQRGEVLHAKNQTAFFLVYGSIPLCVHGVNFFGKFSSHFLPFQVFLSVRRRFLGISGGSPPSS